MWETVHFKEIVFLTSCKGVWNRALSTLNETGNILWNVTNERKNTEKIEKKVMVLLYGSNRSTFYFPCT